MNTPDYFDDLLDHLHGIESRDDFAKALQGLLTPTELAEVCKRLQIFRMLEAGVPQREIAKQLGVGIATVTRGSRALQAEERND